MTNRYILIQNARENTREKFASEGRSLRRAREQRTGNDFLDSIIDTGVAFPTKHGSDIFNDGMTAEAIEISKNIEFQREIKKVNDRLPEGEQLSEFEINQLRVEAEESFIKESGTFSGKNQPFPSSAQDNDTTFGSEYPTYDSDADNPPLPPVDNDTTYGSAYPTPDPDADNPTQYPTSGFVDDNLQGGSLSSTSGGFFSSIGSGFSSFASGVGGFASSVGSNFASKLASIFGSSGRTPGVIPNTGVNPNRFRNMPTNTEEFLAFTGNLNNYLNGISVRSGFVQSQQRLNEASAIQDAAQAAVFKLLEGDGNIKDQFISSIGQTVIQELTNPGSRLSESLGGQAGLSLEGGFGAGLLPGEHQGMNYSRSQQAEFIINFLKKWGR